MEMSKISSEIMNVEKVEETLYYDTTWLITLRDGEMIKSISIVRYSTENLSGIYKALKNLKKYDDESIASLDLRNSIYYD